MDKMAQGPIRVFLRTWGCTLNHSDSDIMSALLIKEGFSIAHAPSEADVLILNTCTVKGATENKILAQLRKLSEGGAKVVVAGCLTVNRDRVRKSAPEAVLLGPGAIAKIGDAVRLAMRRQKADFSGFEKKYELPRIAGGLIARIPIQEGCASKCAFCQTRLARPFLMSYPEKEAVRLVEEAVKGGAREIQITGMDAGAYGIEIGSNLAKLMCEVLKINGNFKIRLGMANPNHVSRMKNELSEIFNHPKMYRFIHMPVQTGSEKVCQEMNRDHTVKEFADCAAFLRKSVPQIMVATDIISAYPTETDEDHELTMEMLESVRPDLVNLSHFTPRPGTEASRLPQLDSKTAKRRTLEVHTITKKIMEENARKFIGLEMDAIIIENAKKGQMKGRVLNYRQLIVNGGREMLGKEIRVKITNASHNSLFGELTGK